MHTIILFNANASSFVSLFDKSNLWRGRGHRHNALFKEINEKDNARLLPASKQLLDVVYNCVWEILISVSLFKSQSYKKRLTKYRFNIFFMKLKANVLTLTEDVSYTDIMSYNIFWETQVHHCSPKINILMTELKNYLGTPSPRR